MTIANDWFYDKTKWSNLCLNLLSFNFFAFQYKELSYVSSWSITENDFTEAIWAVEKYPEEFLPHITSVISMEEVQSRMTAMASGKLQDVKVIIDPHR